MTITRQDRYRGAMVGALCGDAAGAPYEWKRSHEITSDILNRLRGGLPSDFELFDYIEPWKKKRMVKKGHPTDDSELTAALAQSLVAYPELNSEDLYMRLRDFIHGNDPTVGRRSILAAEAYGTGTTLRASLKPKTYEESRALFEADQIPTPPSNGSLMRSAPIALAAKNVFDCVDIADRQSAVTHRNIYSRGACAMYSLVMYYVLQGRSPAYAWMRTQESLQMCDGFRISKPLEEQIWREPPFGPGDVLVSFQAAMWAVTTATDFADGILKVIALGGDTDTYACIAGGLLGAHFGIQGIPPHWLEVLQGKEIMIDLADKLYEIAHP